MQSTKYEKEKNHVITKIFAMKTVKIIKKFPLYNKKNFFAH